jgi:hypothetical protein
MNKGRYDTPWGIIAHFTVTNKHFIVRWIPINTTKNYDNGEKRSKTNLLKKLSFDRTIEISATNEVKDEGEKRRRPPTT